jgi:Flp pilus assembly protein TadG
MTHLRSRSAPRCTSRSRRGDDDRGVAFIEFIIAVPFLMVMVFGIVETGLGWRAVVQVHSAVRGAARVASKDGANGSADYDALSAIAAALPADLRDSSSNIKVVIFNAGSGSGVVPSACLTVSTASGPATPHGISGSCNVYDWQNLTAANLATTANFGCSGRSDNSWCPTSRNVDLSTDNMDYIGIYISTTHHNQTNTYFGDFNIKRQVVFRLEPLLGS